MVPRALLLDAHSRAAVEALQALGRAGIQVDAACEKDDCLAYRSRYARTKVRQPSPANAAEFLSWISALDAERGYGLILAGTEASLIALRELPESDPLRAKAVLPSNTALDTALDKERTWELARSLGIPVPETLEIASDQSVEPAAFPLVLKPVRSKVAVDGRVLKLAPSIVRDEEERRSCLRAWTPVTHVLQQAYVPGRGVGVEFLYDRGHKLWQFGHERLHEWPLTGGGSTYRRSWRPDPIVLAASEALLSALRWHGVAMVKYKVTADGGFYLMEINPRLWGSLALAIDAGVDFPLGLWKLARGEVVPPQPRYRLDYYTRNIANDIKWMKANRRANSQDPLLMTRPWLRSAFEYLRPLLGCESWDHFDFRDPGVTLAALRRVLGGVLGRAGGRVQERLLIRRLVRRHKSLLHARGFAARSMRRLLFLCHGNICRSPVAAQFAKQVLNGYQIDSAGFHEELGRNPPPNVVRAASSMGIEVSHWRSRRVTPEQIARADLILVMDLRNYRNLAREFPEAVARATLLGLFGPRPLPNIRNPYGLAEAETRRILEQIGAAVRCLAEWLRVVHTKANDQPGDVIEPGGRRPPVLDQG